MKFVIRDDDVNYFSSAVEIERWYGDILAQHIPFGLAAIPFVNPKGDRYPSTIIGEDREYPISENERLVSYIKNHPLIEILQHGTTHKTKDGIFEYARGVSVEETRRGRKELEYAFQKRVTVFVPPHDWIGSDGIRAIEAANMNVIRGRGAGLRNFIARWQYVAIFFRMLWFKGVHGLFGNVPAYPYVLDFGRHKEICSYRLEDEDVFEGLDYAARKEGIFVVVTHLHFYTDEKKERLLRLIDEGKKRGATFVAPGALFV